jgi:glycogen synthase
MTRVEFPGWKKNWNFIKFFFSDREVHEFTAMLEEMTVRHVVFCSFENRFARSGGLAAVSKKLLPYLSDVDGIEGAYLVSPFYRHIMDNGALEQSGMFFTVPFNDSEVTVEILRFQSKSSVGNGEVIEYYLKADGFFDACNHIDDPYIYDESNEYRSNERLKDNALFFCKAVPQALKTLGLTKDIALHLQEWQTTLLTLSSKEAMVTGILESCVTVQTMHNPYDAFFSLEELRKLGLEERRGMWRTWEAGGFFENGFSAYRLGLQLVDGPVTTVSNEFAHELHSDIMQTLHFAPHLQEIFRDNGVYGVTNGMFIDFSPEFSDKSNWNIETVERIKTQKRRELLEILADYHPPKRFGDLTYQGDTIRNLPDDIPVIFMNGRLDAGQKGFDVLLRAAEKFQKDEIKIILSPLPVRDRDLDYFYEAACKCRGNVTVFPIFMEKGFRELQMGSTFGLMPSIYEPFGSAIEYLVNGTPAICHDTGGLKAQVVHEKSGFLYREPAETYSLENIKQFAEFGDIVQGRKRNPWFEGMAEALFQTLLKASEMYRERRPEYFRMILEGFKMAEQFDWQKCAKRYVEAFRIV